jgi:VWFA-related protein
MKARTLFLFAVLSALVLGPSTNSAQAVPAGAAADVPTILDVVVTDKADRPITGLQAGDFKVIDNKTQQSVIGLREVAGETPNADPPVEAILLVDEINTLPEVMARERKDIEAYLRQSGGQLPLPTSLVFLTDTELQYQGKPSRDPKVLLDSLASHPNPQRRFQWEGGYQAGVQQREKSLEGLNGLVLKLQTRPGRKLVIWISHGWLAFPQESIKKSAKEMDGLFTYIVSLSTMLRDARITLYSVDPYGAQRDLFVAANNDYQIYTKGVASAKQADNGDLYLQVIATQTGGKVLFGSNNVAKMIDQCVADAQAFYVLTFNAPHATHPNEYNGIQVQVNKPGLKARARTGFYAQP